jgi:hypothetical protein
MPLPKRPEHYHLSPLVGAPARNRTWLAFHRGRVGPLRCAEPCCAALCCAMLCCSVLRHAVLRCAALCVSWKRHPSACACLRSWDASAAPPPPDLLFNMHVKRYQCELGLPCTISCSDSPAGHHPHAQVQPGNPGYSRGIRQSLAKAAEKGGWLEKHKIVMGE